MLADFQICISAPLKPLHLITNKLNGYFKENNGNKYLTPDTAGESKDTLKKYEELGTKSEVLLDQRARTQMIMIKNMLKSNLILTTIYLYRKPLNFKT